MQNRTIDEWIRIYEKKTTELFSPHPDYKLLYIPERGFCEIRISDKMVSIYQMCGCGVYWKHVGESIALS